VQDLVPAEKEVRLEIRKSREIALIGMFETSNTIRETW
jgi:hypothetical protein